MHSVLEPPKGDGYQPGERRAPVSYHLPQDQAAVLEIEKVRLGESEVRIVVVLGLGAT